MYFIAVYIIIINFEVKINYKNILFEKEEKEVKSSKKNIIFDNYIINNMFRNLWV